ncbi:VOC family protein [Flavobacterium sp.]|uniref:VOC family protein n=1 Tax=Flavobacterium sp. TaxID=239 RepID=UPI001B63E7D5|nr:VOC family protein [Flavobacterium sp.]MBP6182696.1 VOC family protein [Flavobacterium sp.]
MAQINPHILFKGNTEEAFNFYKSVFGGEYAMLMRMKDLPNDPNNPISEIDANKIIHIALPIGKSNILMGSDVAEQFMNQELVTGNRYTISISAESKEEADKLFNGLSAGGQIEIPIADSHWDTYFGMFADKFGIQWMVDFDPKYKGQI